MKGSAPEDGGHGTGFPGLWAEPQVPELRVWTKLSDIGFDFGRCCVKPGVGHHDPCGSLSTQVILCFYEVFGFFFA